MARPTLRDSDKRRTVPFRMGKPDYRALLMLMKLSDRTIQEHLRDALDKHVQDTTAEIQEQVSFKLPSPYELGAWSDDAFEDWLARIGQVKPGQPPKVPEAPKPAFKRRMQINPARASA